MLGSGLSFFGIGLSQAATFTPEEENILTKLAQTEYPPTQLAGKLYSDLAKGFLETLTLKEATQTVGLVLRKRFEMKKDVEKVFQRSFAYHLTAQLLLKLGYPVGQDAKSLLQLIVNMAFDTGFGLKNLDNNIKAREVLNKLKTFPPEVLLLFTPLYHALMTNTFEFDQSLKSSQEQFLEVFSRLFLFQPLVNVELPSVTDDVKVALAGNASWLNLFPSLFEGLKGLSESYKPSRSSDQAFVVAKGYQKLLSLHTLLITIDHLLNEIKRKMKKPITEWSAIYDKAQLFVQGLQQSLRDEIVGKNLDEINTICDSIQKELDSILLRIINPLPSDESNVQLLLDSFEPFMKRIADLTAIFSDVEKIAEPNSPVQQFYGQGKDSLNQQLETMVVSLVYNLGVLNERIIAEQISQYSNEVDNILKPFIGDRVKDQTLLHLLVKRNVSASEESDNQKATLRQTLQDQIERLLLEGFDPKATTTNYPRSGGWTATLLRRANEPLDVAGLAAQFGNSDIYEAAMRSAGEKLSAMQLFVTQSESEVETSATTSRPASEAFSAQDSEVASIQSSASGPLFAKFAQKAAQAGQGSVANIDEALAKSPTLGWHREGNGVKRQMRAPGATPGQSPSVTPSASPLSTPRTSREISSQEAKRSAVSESQTVSEIEPPVRVTVRRVVRKPSFGASGPNTDVF